MAERIALRGRLAPMAVGATYLAFVHLDLDRILPVAVPSHRRHVSSLQADVVELEHQWIGQSAVGASRRAQIRVEPFDVAPDAPVLDALC